MLVLGRKPGERVWIGEHIVVTVIEAHGNQIRLGIDAPRDVSVHREELKQRMDQESRGAALAAGGESAIGHSEYVPS